jgi:site-specific DNA-methyltransferase (adenine-specific)
MQGELLSFPDFQPTSNAARQCGARRDLEQFFTPEWATVRLVEEFFPHLTSADFVVDPGCGPGAFLKAIPLEVPAIGVEMDPNLAAFAREDTGRDVICGDFRTVVLPRVPTAIIGNPPWGVTAVHTFLGRAAQLLPDEQGVVGFILPAHRLSYSGPVCEWAKTWSIHQTMLPKSLFPRLSWPVVFAQFRKERVRHMVGFFLFDEAEALKSVPGKLRLLLVKGKRRTSLWRAVVEEVLGTLGGRASLSQIYSLVEGRRPRPIPTWRDTVRRVLQERPFTRHDDGTWALAA